MFLRKSIYTYIEKRYSIERRCRKEKVEKYI